MKTQREEKNTFNVLCYNVAGLPGIISSSDPSVNTPLISPKLNDYDVVSVQEDFAYHSELISAVEHPYLTPHSGNVPLGDGMNFLSIFQLWDTTRYTWEDRYGILPDTGADELTPKGILYSSMEIAPGFFIDIYNLHADAGTDDGSMEARRSNMLQLGKLIQERSIGKAVIVMGDTNSRYTRDGDNFQTAVLEPNGLSDPWIDIIRDGDIPPVGDALIDHNNPNSAYNEVVDKIWYRNGINIGLEAISYALLYREFVDGDGEQLSDHYPITSTFRCVLDEEVKTSETFGGGGGTAFSFLEIFARRLPGKVSIRSGNRLDNIAFTYDGETFSAGGNGGTYRELILGNGEYITAMQLCKSKRTAISTYRISYIKLTTNQGRTLEGGVRGGEEKTFTAPDNYAIAAVHGFSGDEIDRLGAVYLRVAE